MARTPIYHEEKKALIIQAALATFSKYGFEGTTNKLIAEEAGKLIGQEGKPISPALIYHYFPEGKTQLFNACMAQFPPLHQLRETIKANFEQPPEVFIRVFVNTYNELLKAEGVLPIIRIIIGEGGRQPELVNMLLLEWLRPNLLVPIYGYMEKQIQAGRIKSVTFDQVGLQLIAPIFMRRVMLATFPRDAFPFEIGSDKDFLEKLIQTFLKGFFEE
jgi:AcrR family transcriptional regulator